MKDDDYYNPSCRASIASPDSAAQLIHSSNTLKLYFHLTSLRGADDTRPQSSNPQYQLCHTLEQYLRGSLSSLMAGQCNSKILQAPETAQAWTVLLRSAERFSYRQKVNPLNSRGHPWVFQDYISLLVEHIHSLGEVPSQSIWFGWRIASPAGSKGKPMTQAGPIGFLKAYAFHLGLHKLTEFKPPAADGHLCHYARKSV